MNTIDLIVCLMLVLAVWNGWRQGFVMQVCSLAGIIAGIWVASRYGAEVGAWLKLDETISAAGGFVVVLLAVSCWWPSPDGWYANCATLPGSG